MKYLCLVITALIAFGLLSSVRADDLDQWCSEATKASSRVICSDAGLRQLTFVRSNLLLQYKQYLTPDQQKEIDKNQSGWVVAYTNACGVARDGPVPLTISPQVVACFRAAYYERNAAIQTAINKISGATATIPPTQAPAPAPAPNKPDPVVSSPSSSGLSFTTVQAGENQVIRMSGPIETGDFLRFSKFLGRVAAHPILKHKRIAAVSLNSPGGIVNEAIVFAQFIQKGNFGTIVVEGNQCASSCVVMFAAGSKRIVGSSVYIGVHSARNQFDEESPGATATTVMMARILGEYGVPSAIIGRMVMTGPKSAYRLTEADLRAWNVVIVQ